MTPKFFGRFCKEFVFSLMNGVEANSDTPLFLEQLNRRMCYIFKADTGKL